MNGIEFKEGQEVLIKRVHSSTSRMFDGKICTISKVGHNYYELEEENTSDNGAKEGIWHNEAYKIPNKKGIEIKGYENTNGKRQSSEIGFKSLAQAWLPRNI